MLKEAIEKIVSLAAPVTFEIDGYTYASQRLERIEEPEDRPRPLEVSGLDSLCKLICTEIEKVGTTIMISSGQSQPRGGIYYLSEGLQSLPVVLGSC